MLDRAGVPQETKWRALILFCREIREFKCLSDVQKTEIQQVMTEVFEYRNFSTARFDDILRKQHDIITGPHKKKIEELFREANAIIKEFHNLLSVRYTSISELEDTVVATVEGDLDQDEMIRQLRSSFNTVKVMLENDMRSLERLAHKDGVTGIANRRAFDMFMEESVARWQNENISIGLALFDIDLFKRFNDEHGHRIGDQALLVVAKQIAHHAQTLATGNTRVLAARYGGEEFAMAVSGSEAHMLPKLAEAIRQAIRNFNFLIRDIEGNVVENGLHLTVSAGVAIGWNEWQGALLDNIIDSADKALYFAKASGRDRVVVFAPEEEQRYKLVTAPA